MAGTMARAGLRLFWTAPVLPARTLSLGAARWKRVDVTTLDENSQVQFINVHNERQLLSLGEVKQLALAADNRQLFQVTKKGTVSQVPTFKLLNASELDTALRKTRHFKSELYYDSVNFGDGTEVRVETTPTRIKEKQITIKDSMAEHDFEVAVQRIRGWLRKNKFVRVSLQGTPEQQTAMKNQLHEACREVFEANPETEQRLITK